MKLLIASLSLLLLVGCRTVEVDFPDGKVVKYNNFLFNTTIGKFEAHDSSGSSLTFEQLDGNTQALETASKAIDLAREVTTKVP